MTVAISVRRLSKRYRLGAGGAGYGTLRDALSRLVRRPTPAEREDELWALREVSFEVSPGEVVGLVGRNGAGKSTLLKVLSRITTPSDGEVVLRGRIGSLLEVGTGFHPELTGRENVLLSGAILGMRRAEILRRFDEIVEFAGLDRFIDTPVKHFSSGMYMRLAFAVAAHLEPEVLLVDEVLAVGDLEFQRKCLGKMGEVARGGRTVVLVSHNMGAIRGLCGRALLIEGGRLIADGPSAAVVDQYLAMTAMGAPLTSADPRDVLRVERVSVLGAAGVATRELESGEEITIELVLTATRPVERPFLWVGVTSRFGSLFGASNLLDGACPARLEGTSTVRCRFRAPVLLPQTYTVRMGARASDGGTFLMVSQDVATFNVVGTARALGFRGESAETLAWESAPLVVPYEWEQPDGRRVAFCPSPGSGEGHARVDA